MRSAPIIALVPVVACLWAGCREETSQPQGAGPARETEETSREEVGMKLTSTAFEHGGRVPSRHTCQGSNTSPPLAIDGVPEGTQSLALVMDDPDAPLGTYDHWVVWNIPPDIVAIEEGREPQGTPGVNSSGERGYFGPCPPSGTHRYRFKLYALDTVLDLREGSPKAALEKAMDGHVLAQALLEGNYSKR